MTTLQLTDEMRQALSEHSERPIHVVDATTQKSYVLMPEGTYQKLQAFFYDEGDPDPREFMALAHEAFKEDWNSPGMEAYDDYDRHRQAP